MKLLRRIASPPISSIHGKYREKFRPLECLVNQSTTQTAMKHYHFIGPEYSSSGVGGKAARISANPIRTPREAPPIIYKRPSASLPANWNESRKRKQIRPKCARNLHRPNGGPYLPDLIKEILSGAPTRSNLGQSIAKISAAAKKNPSMRGAWVEGSSHEIRHTAPPLHSRSRA